MSSGNCAANARIVARQPPHSRAPTAASRGVRMNTRFLAVLLSLGTQGPVMSQEGATSGDLVVIDLRPKEEREGFGLAALDGKCNEDVFRIPDVASDPL